MTHHFLSRVSLRHSRALLGLLIIISSILVGVFAGQIAPYGPTELVGRRSQPPTTEFVLGTTHLGEDVFSQIVYGTRTSLGVAFLTGTLVTAIGILIGVTAGYLGGLIDEGLMLLTNVTILVPRLPLMVVVAAWLQSPGPVTIVAVLSLVGWAFAARELRAQTLALRESEFVASARVIGEPLRRIIVCEIAPNMLSLVASVWIGAVLFIILAQAALEFIGLGDPSGVSWGMTLYWARESQALLTGRWWTFIPPGVCIALVGVGLTLINYGFDEITNPRLQIARSAHRRRKRPRQSEPQQAEPFVPEQEAEPLLAVQDLQVEYATERGIVRAVDGVSFDMNPGEVLGLVGESGSGKTTIAYAIVRLHLPPANIVGGHIWFHTHDVLEMNPKELRTLRWNQVSVVFQSAMNALNPVQTVGEQFIDTIRAHEDLSRDQARNRALDLLRMCGVDPTRIDSYPHQLSGGMRQRVVIAIAFVLGPELIIMDEPTSALDVEMQRQIMDQVRRLQTQTGVASLFITHDISLLVEYSDRIAVMYAGEIVEIAPTQVLIHDPLHPYTRRLIQSVPTLESATMAEAYSIPGSPPDMISPPSGCRFHPRCDMALTGRCQHEAPRLRRIAPGRVAACHLLEEDAIDS